MACKTVSDFIGTCARSIKWPAEEKEKNAWERQAEARRFISQVDHLTAELHGRASVESQQRVGFDFFSDSGSASSSSCVTLSQPGAHSGTIGAPSHGGGAAGPPGASARDDLAGLQFLGASRDVGIDAPVRGAARESDFWLETYEQSLVSQVSSSTQLSDLSDEDELDTMMDEAAEDMLSFAVPGLCADCVDHATSTIVCDSCVDDGALCAICLRAFKTGSILRVLPCLHKFHTRCIDRWLAQSGVCPVCKYCITF